MAKKSSLREFQENLSAKLQSLATGEAARPSKLGIQVGSQYWLVNLSDISETLPVPLLITVPLVLPWFCGVTNIRGNLYAVIDFCQFLGVEPIPFGVDFRLLLVHPKFKVNSGIIVGRVMGLRNIEQMQLVPTQGESLPWVVAEYRDENGNLWQELDMQALIGHDRFLNVGLA